MKEKNKSTAELNEVKTSSARRAKNLPETMEENKLGEFLRRIFGADESAYEDRLSFIGKWVIFGLLLLVEVLLLLQHIEILVKTQNWVKFTILFAAALVLTIAESLKMFILKKEKYNVVFFFSYYFFVLFLYR